MAEGWIRLLKLYFILIYMSCGAVIVGILLSFWTDYVTKKRERKENEKRKLYRDN